MNFKVVRGKPNEKTALDFLHKLKKDVDPIVKKRNWFISNIEEFYPKNKNLLGMNKRCGSITTIFIRLRYPGNDSFMDYDSMLETMLHELAHMEVGPHNKEFFKLLDTLRKEIDMDMRGFREKFKHNYSKKDLQTDNLFSGCGRPCGSSSEHKFKDKRGLVARATSKRMEYAKLTGRPQKLGSDSNPNFGLDKKSLREKRLIALEKRLSNQLC